MIYHGEGYGPQGAGVWGGLGTAGRGPRVLPMELPQLLPHLCGSTCEVWPIRQPMRDSVPGALLGAGHMGTPA